MSLKFGTDGVRGPASELDEAFVVALGRAAGRVLIDGRRNEPSRRFVVGRDTRESGPRIERALRAGIEAEGIATESLGVVPTPAVASISRRDQVPAAMISASHNPFADNGIKFFAAGGLKLADAVEQRLEAELEHVLAGRSVGAASPGHVLAATTTTGDEGEERDDAMRYRLDVIDSIAGRRLDDLHVVIDCANGAASLIAPDVLARLGATVSVIHADPDGRNINEGCGSTHPASLQAAVVGRRAHVGLAFDGDADRVLAVDENGALVDGDHLLAMCAIDMRDRGELVDDTVVVTVMTNLGFRISMAEKGIAVVETQVGDRYVLEALEAGGFTLGGEQSGHLIFRRLATTGDGLLSGVQLLDLMVRSARPLSDLAAASMTVLPQVMVSVPVGHRDPAVADKIRPAILAVEQELGDRGRVLVRPSGTEPVVRVMVEATDEAAAARAVEQLTASVVAICGRA